jgi:LytS/YehU family sensor histidine kinase
LFFFTTGEINLQLIYKDSKPAFFIGLTFTIVATMIANAIYFFIKWKGAAVNEERLKREALSLQFNALKNQVHPHFLFNSLSALTSMIRNDHDQAIRFVDQLSAVYRYLLEYKDREIIDLKTELAFLDSYIYLHKIRHGDNLEVEYVKMEKPRGAVITFSVQMLVENAIKHNEISSDRPLRIEIEYTPDGYIRVKNNLQPRSSVLRGSRLGLENISERYKILSGRDVKIIRGPEKFEVGLPLLPVKGEDLPSET